jgi:uncharacterized protein YndB with AHSA1/START domain
MSDTQSTIGLEATVTRVFNASRERVWTCLTDPEDFAQWFGTPPFTTPVETVTMEVRPGGEFRATMVHETDGTELPFLGRFLEVEPLSRLVQTMENPINPSDPDVEVITTTLSDAGEGRTKVVYHQAGHLPPEQYPMIEQGVAGFYDRLAGHLARW